MRKSSRMPATRSPSARKIRNLGWTILLRFAAGFVALALLGRPAWAEGNASPPDQPTSGATPAVAPHEGNFWTQDALTGNWGGWRSWLEDHGIVFGVDSIDEVLGDPLGGTRQSTVYEGQLELLATVDLGKTLGWAGATLHAQAFQIRGSGLSENDLGDNLATVSSIEADRALRLGDLWVEQSLFHSSLSIRAGQIAADDEFFTSDTASTFVNSTFGWPAILATNLPNGGPTLPLATPGIRVKYAASDTMSALFGIFNGDPAGAGPGDAQTRDASGTTFRIGGAFFLILEGDYAANQDANAKGLARSYKIGAWFHSGTFADPRFATNGVSLASPASSGLPALHRDDAGVYFILDRQVFRQIQPVNRSVSVFLRLAAAPPDRNEVSLYADAGVSFAGFVPGRPNDSIGLAAAVAKISSRAGALDKDYRRFTGLDTPVRDAEAVIELTYQCAVTPWWSLQPDLQFIRHPGGNILVPGASSPTRAVPNALVIGLRSSIVF